MYRRAIFPYYAIGITRFDLKNKIILSVGCFWSHLKVEIAAGIALNWKSMQRVRIFFGPANACGLLLWVRGFVLRIRILIFLVIRSSHRCVNFVAASIIFWFAEV